MIQVICTDKIAMFFSEIIHKENYLEKYFFKKNDYMKLKV